MRTVIAWHKANSIPDPPVYGDIEHDDFAVSRKALEKQMRGKQLPSGTNDTISLGRLAELKVLKYRDWLVSTMHPTPLPADAKRRKRDPATRWDAESGRHPCELEFDWQNFDSDRWTAYHKDMVNAVQRHECGPVCGKKDEACRFRYPIKRERRSRLRFVQCKDEQGGATAFVEGRRNDRWINSHSKIQLCAWGANVDLQLLVDVGRVAHYMAKYATKGEKMSPGLHKILKNVAMSSESETSADTGLRSTMIRAFGGRDKGAQEVAASNLSMSLCHCNIEFVKANLSLGRHKRLNIPDNAGDNSNEVEVQAIKHDIEIGRAHV